MGEGRDGGGGPLRSILVVSQAPRHSVCFGLLSEPQVSVFSIFPVRRNIPIFFLPGEMSQFFLLRRILLKYCSSGECERWAASEHIQPFLGARRQNQPTKCIQQVQTSLPVCGTNKWNNVTQPTDQVHTSLVHLRTSPLFNSYRNPQLKYSMRASLSLTIPVCHNSWIAETTRTTIIIQQSIHNMYYTFSWFLVGFPPNHFLV